MILHRLFSAQDSRWVLGERWRLRRVRCKCVMCDHGGRRICSSQPNGIKRSSSTGPSWSLTCSLHEDESNQYHFQFRKRERRRTDWWTQSQTIMHQMALSMRFSIQTNRNSGNRGCEVWHHPFIPSSSLDGMSSSSKWAANDPWMKQKT